MTWEWVFFAAAGLGGVSVIVRRNFGLILALLIGVTGLGAQRFLGDTGVLVSGSFMMGAAVGRVAPGSLTPGLPRNGA
jgi:hypothetical protein